VAAGISSLPPLTHRDADTQMMGVNSGSSGMEGGTDVEGCTKNGRNGFLSMGRGSTEVSRRWAHASRRASICARSDGDTICAGT
jgi:hypothetical protein